MALMALHITDLGLGEITMCHIVVKLFLFSGFDDMQDARDGCSVRRKHRCAKCVNKFAATCTTVHRLHFYNIREEVLVVRPPPWLQGLTEHQI